MTKTKKSKPNMWVLITVTDDGSDGYIWTFYSRDKARAHKEWQESHRGYARLEGPFRYKFDKSAKG